MTFSRRLLAALLATPALATPISASACACGCGIFDVGDNSVMPQSSDSGWTAFIRAAFMNQDRNHEGSNAASADDNADKRIATAFYTVGAEYRINSRWSVMAQVPLVDRRFTTTATNGDGEDVIETKPLAALGDAMVRVTYSGLFSDRATALHLGIKLPTGRISSPTDLYGNQPYDRDTMPGTGSTDLQFGAAHAGTLGAGINWFGQAQYQFAVAKRDHYRPGNELIGAVGISYDLTRPGAKVGIKPVLQLIGTVRAHDTGDNADPLNSGYRRLLVAPGLRLQLSRKLSVYGDVEWAVAQNVNAASPADNADSMGQLVAPALFKIQLNYGF